MKVSPPTARPIFVISGTPGSGKSTIAKTLLQHFELGIHIPVDDIREWVTAGIAHPIPKWTDETERQFRLARWAALQTATIYAEAGFTVALDDVVQEPIFQRQYQQLLHGYRIYKVLLSPSIEVALERNATRTHKAFDTKVLTEAIHHLSTELRQANHPQAGWLVIDNSTLTIDETVTQILAKTGEG
jgi:predicted kinase